MARFVPIKIGGISTTALTAIPAGQGPFPGVVVTFHRDGLDKFAEWMVDQLAANGFAAIAPNHFHVIPEGVNIRKRNDYLTDEQMALDLEAAAGWLSARADTDSDRLGLLGPCMGGRTVLMGLEAHPDLWKVGALWYPGSVFKPLRGDWPAPGDRERLRLINCPMIGFFGNDDTHPTPEEVDRLDRLLAELDKAHSFFRYDAAGHAFLNLTGQDYRPGPAADSWAKAMAFIGGILKNEHRSG